MRVLIAEDDPNQLRVLEKLVSSWGYEAVIARDGREAWQALESKNAPKLAVLDGIMPGMGGLEIIRALREIEQASPPYLIVLSALDSREDVVKGLAAGANDYVKKPADSAELRARLEVGARVLDLQERLAQRIAELQNAIRETQMSENANRQLLAAVEQASEGVVITDGKGTIQYVNAAFLRMSGYARQQVIGSNPRLLKSDQNDRALYEELWTTVLSGQVWTGELINRRADGSLYTEHMSITPTRDGDGLITNFIAIKKDVTEEKAAELALRESERRYRLQSVLLRAICDVSPDGILVVDPRGAILSHNRRFLEIWQLDSGDHVGLDDAPLLAAALARVKHPEDFLRRIEALYADPEADDHCEIELKDNRTLDQNSAALRDADGNYLGRVWFFRDITERTQAEQTRTLISSIVQCSEDAIFGLENGRIISWNRGAEEIYGYSEAEAKGRHASMLAPPDRHEEQMQMREKVARGEHVSNFETTRLTKDGRLIEVSLSISPITNGVGDVVSEAVIARDISARKRAERARAEEARLALLSAEVGAALTGGGSLHAGLQQCTEALVRGTSVTVARIWTLEPGATMLELKASAGMCSYVEGISARIPLGRFKVGRIAQTRIPLLNNKERTDIKAFENTKVNREQLVGFVGHPLMIGDEVMGVVAAWAGRPLTEATLLAFSAVAKQVAQFIHARRAEEALRRSEERARLLFAAIPHAAYVFDMDTLDFLEVNDRAVERYGYSREEFMAMKTTEIRPAEEAARLREYLDSHRDSEHAGQWKHRTRDGRIIDVEISYHGIDYGGRRAALTIAQDISERKKLEVDLRHAQKLESVGRLASGIAHEINTPVQFVGDNLRFLKDSFSDLQHLLGKYQNLLEEGEAGKVRAELLKEVRETIERADLEYLQTEIPKALDQSLDGVGRVATIVKAMKDFAHPEQNHKIATNLNQALTSTLVVARNELKYVADVETHFGDLPLVECHVGDLNQVFLNLFVNAAHAIAEVVSGTGQKGTIRVETRQDGDWVQISISDTGCGIPEGIRAMIFDPFFTTKDVGRGTGQGLAISRSIVVDKHGGTLKFESEIGRGTTFYIGLPIGSQSSE